RDELAAAHLRGRDVDVVVAGVGRRHAQEARAVAEQLDDALGDALGGLGVCDLGDRSLGLGLGLGLPLALVGVTARTPAPATAPTAARALGGLGVRSGVLDCAGAVLAALAGEDRVDEVGLAQPAVAVDAELGGERVQVGERAVLEAAAIQDGHDGLLPWLVGGLRPRGVAAGDSIDQDGSAFQRSSRISSVSA